MTPYLLWGDEEWECVEVSSLAALDATVDRLESAARGNMPHTVELYHTEERLLLIMVGHEASYVAFYSTDYRPYRWACRGPWDDDEHIEFLYRGHHSGIDRRYTVPRAAAREALRRFFATGDRPDNLTWEII